MVWRLTSRPFFISQIIQIIQSIQSTQSIRSIQSIQSTQTPEVNPESWTLNIISHMELSPVLYWTHSF